MSAVKTSLYPDLDLQIKVHRVKDFDHYPDQKKLIVRLTDETVINQVGFDIATTVVDKNYLFENLKDFPLLVKSIINHTKTHLGRQHDPVSCFMRRQGDGHYGVYVDCRKVATVNYAKFNVEQHNLVTDRGILTYYTGTIYPTAIVGRRMKLIRTFPKTFSDIVDTKIDKEKLIFTKLIGLTALGTLSSLFYIVAQTQAWL